MTEDVLDLIGEIAELRREIREEIESLKTRIDAAQPEILSGFKKLAMLRYGQVKLTFMASNIQEACEVLQDLASWWQAKAARNKTYGADMRAAGNADIDVKIPLLLKIKEECQDELNTQIPQMRDLTVNLEMLRAQYNEILER
jgi:hypothetical protein